MRPSSLASVSLVLLASCSSPKVLASPTLPLDTESSEPSDSDRAQRKVAETLARVERAMAPICEGHCGTVGAVPDLDLDAGAGTIPAVRGYASLVLYRPDGSCVRESEEVRFYCMAHEYGHHLDVAMSEQRSQYDWAGELRADALAGCAMTRAGISLERLKGRFDSWTSAQSRTARACGVDEAHPALEWTWQAIRVGADVCAQRNPTKTAILDAAEPVIQTAYEAARRERKRLMAQWHGAEPCLAPLH